MDDRSGSDGGGDQPFRPRVGKLGMIVLLTVFWFGTIIVGGRLMIMTLGWLFGVS